MALIKTCKTEFERWYIVVQLSVCGALVSHWLVCI